MNKNLNSHKRILRFYFLFFIIVASAVKAQMITPGQFQVAQSGSANYSIPLQTPPGVSGLEPKLSLNYDSQSGNSFLGLSWSLGGLSSITRCPETVAQDGILGKVSFDSNDRFCMDGSRLDVVVGAYGTSGSEYRTERESFSKITAVSSSGNGPASFIVQTKSGLIMEYGSLATARMEGATDGSVIAWSLNKVSDRNGNSFVVSYTKNTATRELLPAGITYTSNTALGIPPSVELKFLYEIRPDLTTSYQQGLAYQNAHRMVGIQLFVASMEMKEYRLTYVNGAVGRSLLSGIQECGPSNVCQPAIALQYSHSLQNNLPTNFSAIAQNSMTAISLGDHLYQSDSADFNGDGRTDLIALHQGVEGWDAWVSLGKGDGTFEPAVQHVLTTVSLGDSLYQGYLGDFNGDGKTDLIALHQGVEGWDAWVSLGNGDGTFSPATLHVLATASLGDNLYQGYLGDFNGDGRTDLIALHQGAEGWDAWVSLGKGDGTFEPAVQHVLTTVSLGDSLYQGYLGDFNGDGKTDLIALHQGVEGWDAWVSLGNGDGAFSPATLHVLTTASLGDNLYQGYLGDFNGDGRTDLIALHQGVEGWDAWVSLGKGDGTFEPAVQHVLTTVSLGDSLYQGYLGDFNGDGKTDLISMHQGVEGWDTWVSLGNGDGTFKPAEQHVLTTVSLGDNLYQGFPVDLNGDGKTDLIALHQGVEGWISYTSMRNGEAGIPDLLQVINNGISANLHIAYGSLVNNVGGSQLYFKDNSASYPLQDIQSPLYVVASVASVNGVGGITTTQYTYGGLKVDQSGRGSLGFRWQQAKQVESGLTSYSEFRQDWPYIGLQSLTKKTLTGGGNSGVLSQVTSSYGCNDPSSVTITSCTVDIGKRYFVYANQSVSSNWDLNGTALPMTTTNTTYDNWGNATAINVSTSDGFSKSTINSFSNDSTNWLLGRLLRASVTSVSP